jgi:hypothetical protein
MARAFIASVPLAIVVVAALVVPLLVIPGTFGFEGWPTSPPSTVTDRVVRPDTGLTTTVTVEKRPRPVVPIVHRTLASASPTPRKPVAAVITRVAHTPQRRTAAVVQPPRPHHSAPQPQQPARHHTPSAPSTPSAPPAPTPQPAAPAPAQPAPQQVASQEAPVARNDPPPDPPAPTPPAPVQVITPSLPPGDGQDCNGDGHGNGNGEQHGHGLALGHLLGHGHERGQGDD